MPLPRLNHVMRTFQEYATRRNVQVDIVAARDLKAPLVPASLYDGIALNLYTNALKGVTAKIGAHFERISFRAWNDGQWHLLEVSDTGIGIPSAMYERVFDPLFTTTAEGTDPLGSGMGLGLTFVRRSVEAFGGDRPSATAPTRVRNHRSRQPAATSSLRRIRMTKNTPSVLLVDDEQKNLDSFAKKLQRRLRETAQVRTWRPTGDDIPLEQSFNDQLDPSTALVVTDYDLTTSVGGFFGPSIVGWCQSNAIPVADFSRKHIASLPKEPNLFELRVPANDQDGAAMAACLFHGFEVIRRSIGGANDHGSHDPTALRNPRRHPCHAVTGIGARSVRPRSRGRRTPRSSNHSRNAPSPR